MFIHCMILTPQSFMKSIKPASKSSAKSRAKAPQPAAASSPRTRAAAKPLFDPERRASILAAALGVFVGKGFQRSTIRDIARAAGLAEGTIYNHFDNKAELLVGLIDQLQSARRELADLQIDGEGGMPQGLHIDLEDFLPQHFALMLGKQGSMEAGVMGVLLSEMLTDAPMRKAHAAQLFEPVFASGTAAIKQWTKQKLLRKTRPELTSRLIGALMLGVQIQSQLGDAVIAKHWGELPDAMAQLILNGIKKI
jgi:AcrR family transcriptional regulator